MENLDEYYNFDDIMQRMLSKIPDSIDKREGSIIYDALAPCAIEFAQMYIVLKDNIDLVFADTSVDEYLDRLCNQVGIQRMQATKAIKQGMFYNENNNLMNVEIGQRFTCNDTYWIVVQKIAEGIYRLECEAEGIVGNNMSGTMIPVDYIDRLGRAELGDLLIPRRRCRDR